MEPDKTMRTNKSLLWWGLLAFSLSFCDAGVDATKPHCIDQVQNADETDIDCGGQTCQVCSIGKGCRTNGDCLTDACNQGRCIDTTQYASCTDGKQNGLETDIDCGGTCTPCGVGKMCLQSADCGALLCSGNKCGLGSGADGALIVPVGMTQTINQLASPVTGNKLTNQLTVASTTGMAKGQILFIHQTQGSGAGNSELNQIVELNATTVTLARALTTDYSTGAQAVVVPQYTNVTVSATATLTAPAWDGMKGGILVFLASGAVNVDGTLSMLGRGFRGAGMSGVCFPGAPGCLLNHGRFGESEAGPSNFSAMNNNGKGMNSGGGGGGGTRGQDCAAGGGGSYGTVGAAGADGSLGTCIMNGLHGGGLPGTTLGQGDLTQSIFLGPAGGEGGPDESGAYPGPGGNGGGIIIAYAGTLTVNAASGTIDAGGASGGSGAVTGPCGGSGSGMGNGGGGAGGGIRLVTAGASALGTGRVSALGGSGGAGGTCGAGFAGGSGGQGRIQVRTSAQLTGTTTPPFQP